MIFLKWIKVADLFEKLHGEDAILAKQVDGAINNSCNTVLTVTFQHICSADFGSKESLSFELSTSRTCLGVPELVFKCNT